MNSEASKTTAGSDYSVEKLDKVLGRILSRILAVAAFIASAASMGFGLIVVWSSLFPGLLLFLLGALFIWLGLRAWRDRSTLGELLNRDYQSKRE